MAIYYIENENGSFKSADGNRCFMKLSGRQAYEYLKTPEGQNKRFMRTSSHEDGCEEEFVEIPSTLMKQHRKDERHKQYVSDCMENSGLITISLYAILTNEKYKGDAILNKTYIRDCLSKKVMINNGERPKYYVENNHPAISDSGTFGRVQEEMARRGGKRKVKQVGTKTEQGRYSSKYALTELLICGECGTP